VLNVKQIALRMHAEGPKRVSLKAQGPGESEGRPRSRAPPTSEILNPDLVLCTLDEKVDFRMELTIASGKGYVPADPQPPGRRRLIGPDPGGQPVQPVKKSLLQGRELPAKGQILDYDKATSRSKPMVR